MTNKPRAAKSAANPTACVRMVLPPRLGPVSMKILSPFWNSKSFFTINEDGYVVIPKTMEFENAAVKVSYNTESTNAVANLEYFVGDNKIGQTTIDYADSGNKAFEFANIITDSNADSTYTYEPEQKTVFVTISEVIKKLFIVVGILLQLIEKQCLLNWLVEHLFDEY